MALGLDGAVRSNELDQITAAIDAGVAGGTIKIYDDTGARPSNGQTPAPSILLATLTFLDPSFPNAGGGTMQANDPIGGETSAPATGTALWFRIEDSNSSFVMDGDVGEGGSDLNLNTTSITAGVQVDITSMILTAGNAGIP